MRTVQRASSVVLVTVVGGTLILAGIVMLVTPGPGLLAIAAGLAVLAREFSWARRLLDRVKERLPSRDRDRHRQLASSYAPTSAAADVDDTDMYEPEAA